MNENFLFPGPFLASLKILKCSICFHFLFFLKERKKEKKHEISAALVPPVHLMPCYNTIIHLTTKKYFFVPGLFCFFNMMCSFCLSYFQLRNTMENLTCATVKGSAVDMYFRRQVELSNMYRTMEANNYDTAEDAIADVKIG